MQLDCRAQDAEIKDHAIFSAGRARTLVLGESRRFMQHQNPTNFSLAVALDELAVEHGVSPIPKKTCLKGRIARMADAGWWRKRLRVETLRANETIEHAAGAIRRKAQVYVTDHASALKRASRKAGREMLEGLEVVNEDGEAFNLLDVSDASVSNPKHRRAELMTRCRGFEECAEFMGHKGLFLTLTTPSRYHRVNFAGIMNPKWAPDRLSVRNGQDYLCSLWKRIRTAYGKKGITPYGFRVAEPHHDGTPHWHILLFCVPEQVDQLIEIVRKYALKESPNESGAQKRRFTVKHIDPSQGSATGYIAKYISKNIDGGKEDGTDIGLDFDSGTPAEQASKRVKDWASVWGIRQFQQIGGPSVQVWRELRKLGKDADACQLELFEKPRAAASRGDWFAFWMLQGGPEVKRRDLTLKPFYREDDLGRYGDMMKKIKGVLGYEGGNEFMQPTRFTEWTVQRAGAGAINAQQWAWDEALEFAKSNAAFMQAYKDSEFKRIGAADQARTGINNCTPPAFDFSGFEVEDPAESAHLYIKGECADPWDVYQEVNWSEEALEKMNLAYLPHQKTAPGRPPGNLKG